MAVYKIFPLQDSTLYSRYPAMNTGIDAILELSNTFPSIVSNPIVARPLIQFDQSQINSVIDTYVESETAISSSLRAFISNASGIVMESTLEIYPVSGSWNNGSGEYLDNPNTTNGVSWEFRLYSGSDEKWVTDNYTENVTGSYIDSSLGGCNWYTASVDTRVNLNYSQSFNLRTTKDINADVTDIVKTWYSSSSGIAGTYTQIENNGFLLKWNDNIEFNTSLAIQPNMQFYSVDTNTIYPPILEIKWRDYEYDSSLPTINTPDLYLAIDNNPGVFYSESINNFRINCRPEFPARTFQTGSSYTTNFALPPSSYYAIKDLDTNEFIIDFDDEFTQLSCDDTGSYFTLYMNGLEPERYYEILIQTTVNGNTIIKDDQYYFKVVNG
tara:strand:- start:9658 stop:10809 length:1152 start_codon:yes stop_codon:yes gene_type:complete